MTKKWKSQGRFDDRLHDGKPFLKNEYLATVQKQLIAGWETLLLWYKMGEEELIQVDNGYLFCDTMALLLKQKSDLAEELAGRFKEGTAIGVMNFVKIPNVQEFCSESRNVLLEF